MKETFVMSLTKTMFVQLHLLTLIVGVSSRSNSTTSNDTVYISLSLTCIIMAVCIGGIFTATKRIKKRHAGHCDNRSRQILQAKGKDLEQKWKHFIGKHTQLLPNQIPVKKQITKGTKVTRTENIVEKRDSVIYISIDHSMYQPSGRTVPASCSAPVYATIRFQSQMTAEEERS